MSKALLFRVLAIVLARATPEIVNGLRKFALDLQRRAAETPNPIDDVLAALIVDLVGADE